MSEYTKAEQDILENKIDVGLLPTTEPMTDEQKKLGAFMMAINLTLVQLILEGALPPGQELHFLGHLSDYLNRLMNGEKIRIPHNSNTFNVNGLIAEVFYKATERAMTRGSEDFAEMKRLFKEAADAMKAQEDDDDEGSTNVPVEVVPDRSKLN